MVLDSRKRDAQVFNTRAGLVQAWAGKSLKNVGKSLKNMVFLEGEGAAPTVRLFAPIGDVDMKSAPPMLTVAAVETIRSALVIWRRCSIARAAPAPP
jgi:hypothetical protein